MKKHCALILLVLALSLALAPAQAAVDLELFINRYNAVVFEESHKIKMDWFMLVEWESIPTFRANIMGGEVIAEIVMDEYSGELSSFGLLTVFTNNEEAGLKSDRQGLAIFYAMLASAPSTPAAELENIRVEMMNEALYGDGSYSSHTTDEAAFEVSAFFAPEGEESTVFFTCYP